MLMNMLLFELKYQFRKPATHVFALLMFMLAFLFLGTDAASVGGAGPLIKANSPYVLSQIFLTMSIIGLIILPGVTRVLPRLVPAAAAGVMPRSLVNRTSP